MDRRDVKDRTNPLSSTNGCGGVRNARQTSPQPVPMPPRSGSADAITGAGYGPFEQLLEQGIWYEGRHILGEALKQQSQGLRILYLYSGPVRTDGVDSVCRLLGSEAEMLDLLQSPPTNLADSHVWREVESKIRDGHYDAVLMAPPCDTFSRARSHPLRDETPPGIYGKRELANADKAAVQTGTLLALRGAVAAAICNSLSRPWIAETPKLSDGVPSVFKLPEWVGLGVPPEGSTISLDQCRYGARAKKPTSLKASRCSIEDIAHECNHPRLLWTIPWNGKSYWAPHPILRGKQWAIPHSQWRRWMLRRSRPTGDYITRASAHYPAELNYHLTTRLLWAAHLQREKRKSVPRPMPSASSTTRLCPSNLDHSGRPVIHRPTSLRGQSTPADATHSISAMRDIRKSVLGLPGHCMLGPAIRVELDSYLDSHPQIEELCHASLGDAKVLQDHVVPPDHLVQLRRAVQKVIASHGVPTDDAALQPSIADDSRSSIVGGLLHAWAKAARDPGAEIATWLWRGAPAGLEADFEEIADTLPRLPPDATLTPDQLESHPDSFVNHGDVDDDDEAVDIINGYIDRGWLREFGSYDELAAYVKGKPILNKFACLRKERWDASAKKWTTKRRLIMDSKSSQVKEASNKAYRSILPRVFDACHDVMALLDQTDESEHVEMMVLDACEAFWNVPLRHCERKYYCGLLRREGQQRYLCYTRTAQGSRGAPLAWAVLFSLISRCALSTLRETRHGTSELPAAMQVFVDDPWLAFRGSPEQCRRMTATLILVWRILGVDLAFSKGQIGDRVNWIGATLSIESSTTLAVTITQARLDELRIICDDIASKSTITVRTLRSFTGKCQSMASILATWRPFVQMLYGALYGEPSPNLPGHLIHTNRFEIPLRWILAFLRSQRRDVVRVMSVDAHFRRGVRIDITTDASPWGIGAILAVDGRPAEYFAIQTTAEDAADLGLELTRDSKCQQAFEALALLIALRQWRYHWATRRCVLHVASDNMAALAMVCKMQPHSPALNTVARELALDVADSIYEPQVAEHVPGVANIAADALSRKWDPSHRYHLPPVLKHACEVHPPSRPPQWWRARDSRLRQTGDEGVSTASSASSSQHIAPHA